MNQCIFSWLVLTSLGVSWWHSLAYLLCQMAVRSLPHSSQRWDSSGPGYRDTNGMWKLTLMQLISPAALRVVFTSHHYPWSWIVKWLNYPPGLSTHWRWGHVQSCQKLPLPTGYQRPGMPEHNCESKCQSKIGSKIVLQLKCAGWRPSRNMWRMSKHKISLYIKLSTFNRSDLGKSSLSSYRNSYSYNLFSRWMSPTTV